MDTHTIKAGTRSHVRTFIVLMMLAVAVTVAAFQARSISSTSPARVVQPSLVRIDPCANKDDCARPNSGTYIANHPSLPLMHSIEG